MSKSVSKVMSSLLFVGVSCLLFAGCRTTEKALIQPAKQVQRDFYTCKGFDKGLPVDATSEFKIEDGLVYIVADLEKDLIGSRLDFEVSSPNGSIAYMESVEYRENRPYGFYFDTWKLYERGGPGKWRVLFWADGQPVGRLFFGLESDEVLEAKHAQRLSRETSIFEQLFGDEAAPLDLPEEEAAPEEILEETDDEDESGEMITPFTEPSAAPLSKPEGTIHIQEEPIEVR